MIEVEILGWSCKASEGELEPKAAGKLGLAPAVGNRGNPKKVAKLEFDHMKVGESKGRAEVAKKLGSHFEKKEKSVPEQAQLRRRGNT